MRIEDELKTTKFSDEIQKAHVNVIFTAYWIRNRIHQRLKHHNLTLEQYNVLRIIRGQHQAGIRIKDITMRMIKPSSNTTRIIDRLEARGLVTREGGRDDRRERSITLTTGGEELLTLIDNEWEKSSPHVSKIKSVQAAELNELLDKLREI